MSIPGLADPYCTTTYADGILGTSNSTWLALSPEGKEEALQWARVYLDNTYTWSWEPDENGEAPTSVQTANAYAVNCYLADAFFQVEDGAMRGLTRTEVQAGSVMSRKDYDAYIATYGWDDPCPLATAIIVAGGAGLPTQNGISSPTLVRT